MQGQHIIAAAGAGSLHPSSSHGIVLNDDDGCGLPARPPATSQVRDAELRHRRKLPEPSVVGTSRDDIREFGDCRSHRLSWFGGMKVEVYLSPCREGVATAAQSSSVLATDAHRDVKRASAVC